MRGGVGRFVCVCVREASGVVTKAAAQTEGTFVSQCTVIKCGSLVNVRKMHVSPQSRMVSIPFL